MGLNLKCPGYNWGKKQGDKFKYIFDVYSFHHHRRCWPTFIPYLPTMYLIEDVGLPTKCRFDVGPALQPIVGSMPVCRLRRLPNTNLSLGRLYTLRKHVAFYQCCFNADPHHSSTLDRHWNIIGWLYRVFWLLHYAGDTKHQITRYIGPMPMQCWATVCVNGPAIFQPNPFKLLATNIIVNIFFLNTFSEDKST